MLNDVEEGSPGADWRQLPGIADEDEALHAFESLYECPEHFLSQH